MRTPRPLLPLVGGALLLLAVALLAYAPALGGGFIWDDHDWIVENALLRSPEGLRRIWLEPRAFHQYYPLTHTSFWLEYQRWGESTTGYHVVNVGLHALAAWLLWRVLRALELGGAFAAAALFAVHPLAVESVAWITERKNVLSLVLALASLRCWAPFLLDPSRRPLGEGWRRHLAASALFLAAMLAKTAVCTLPALLLLLGWWRHGRVQRAHALALSPWFALALGLGALTAWLERVEVGARGADWALGPLERALVAGRAAWFYAWKVVAPLDLAFIYPRWEVSAAALWQLLPPLGALAALVGLYLARSRIGRGPFMVVAGFLGVLSPGLGFFDVYASSFSFVADHWAYHAMPVLLAALADGGAVALAAAPAALRRGVPVVVCALLVALTRGQAALYVDQETLYRDALEENPRSALLHANLGVVLLDEGQRAEGLSHLQEAARLDPNDEVIAADLGLTLTLLGRDAEAAGQYERILARDPDHGVALNALAGILARSADPAVRDPTRAVSLAERALALHDPAPSEVWATLARAYAAAGREAEARQAAERGLERAKAEGNTRMIEVFQRRLRAAAPRPPG